jgi:hypothetical protein
MCFVQLGGTARARVRSGETALWQMQHSSNELVWRTKGSGRLWGCSRGPAVAEKARAQKFEFAKNFQRASFCWIKYTHTYMYTYMPPTFHHN